jgi:hypothetical protein
LTMGKSENLGSCVRSLITKQGKLSPSDISRANVFCTKLATVNGWKKKKKANLLHTSLQAWELQNSQTMYHL